MTHIIYQGRHKASEMEVARIMTKKELERQQERIQEAESDSDFQWLLSGLLIIVTAGIFTI